MPNLPAPTPPIRGPATQLRRLRRRQRTLSFQTPAAQLRQQERGSEASVGGVPYSQSGPLFALARGLAAGTRADDSSSRVLTFGRGRSLPNTSTPSEQAGTFSPAAGVSAASSVPFAAESML